VGRTLRITSQSDFDARVDELYGLPPGDFTSARNMLARALRAEGDRDAAAGVGKLRRPTIAAWAVNQTVRRHRDRIGALLEAGQDVRRAQRRAMSGVRQSGLREATRARRKLIDELTDLAAQILTDQGSNAETHRGDIAATFDAASGDDEAAATVGAGRLAAPLPVTSGFGGLDGLAVLPAPQPDTEPEAPAEDDAEAAERERAARRRREAIRAVEEARRGVAHAEAEARRATETAVSRAAAADEAARAAREAEETWRRRQREADELQAQVALAREDAAAAEQTVEQRLAELRARQGELDDLEA
jgi:hypothetical protein